MKKIFFLIYILIFTALIFYVVHLFSDRNKDSFQEKEIKIKTPKITITNTSDHIEDMTGDIDETIQPEPKNQKHEIAREDCRNECANVSEETKDYCKEVCGLDSKKGSDNCNSETGLEKDYCWKDLAIKNSDYKICEEISDKNIYETCKIRITEDVVNNSS